MRMFIVIALLALAGCVTTGNTVDKTKMAEGYYMKGLSYLQEKNYEMASVEFNRSLQNDSAYKQSYYGLGIISDYQGKLDDAANYYQKAIAQDPDYSEAYNALGVVYSKQKKWKEAIKAFNKALANKLYTTPHIPYLNLVDEAELLKLRQEMLSCTVENRVKDLLVINPKWRPAINAADDQKLLQAILSYLDSQKQLDLLNNNGIPRMVRGYFYEMACVIAECARVLKPGAPLIMVNDNVRYAGASISVDIILTEIAERLGLEAEQILVLPNGKGNSSQQMGAHGRDSLRKCVYVWRKA